MTPPIDRLKRRLRVAFELLPPDEDVLTDSIYRQRATAWRDAMTEQAERAGLRRAGKLPSGEDAARLRAMSRDDAASIRNTYNRDLERQIAQLYAANPDGDRAYYIRELTAWADDRAAWKDRQITLYNQKTARFDAMQQFKAHNAIEGRHIFTGPAPVCDDCAEKFTMGEVGEQAVQADPTPLHPNCPHEWTLVGARVGVPLQDLWVG